jgi:hypothetical protein
MGLWSTPRPGRFTPGKDLIPIVQEVGWAPGRSRRVRKISPPPGFVPWTVQPVASRYTDRAILAPSASRHPLYGGVGVRQGYSKLFEGQANSYPSQKLKSTSPLVYPTARTLHWLTYPGSAPFRDNPEMGRMPVNYTFQTFHAAPRRGDLDYSQSLCAVKSTNPHVQGQQQEKPANQLIHDFLGPAPWVTIHDTKVSYFLLTVIK